MYQYTTESRNGGVGATNLWNGPKVSCQVYTRLFKCITHKLSVQLISSYLSFLFTDSLSCVIGRD